MSDNLFNQPNTDVGFYHVPQYYEMDPTSDELLFDGGELENGMVVLIENPGLRVPDVDSWLTAYGIKLSAEQIDNLRVWNRWCEVTNLVIDPEPKNGHRCIDRMVRFVGVYADDVKRKLMCDNAVRFYGL